MNSCLAERELERKIGILDKGDGYENCIKIHTKILFDHFLDRDCGWLYLQIGRLFPSRNGMGVFVHSDLAWVLDHYKYNDRPIEFLLFVRGTQFLSIYVWNDIEL